MFDETQILAAARDLLRRAQPVSLDSVARSVGLTKAGVMHYYRTKAQLMLALVDASADDIEVSLRKRLRVDAADEASSVDRVRAYAELFLSGKSDGADLAILGDNRLRSELTERWAMRIEPWVRIDADADPGTRAVLEAVRLMADGAWFGDSADCLPVATRDRANIKKVVDRLLKGLDR